MLRAFTYVGRAVLTLAVAVVVGASPSFAQRTELKPPWNIYSPQTEQYVTGPVQAT